MKDLLVHPNTEVQIDRVIKNRPHAILLTGNQSSGKKLIAKFIAGNILDQDLEVCPYYLEVCPEYNILTIDQIRKLKKFTKLKTTGSGIIRRIAILQDAHLMNTEAQNALLKLLEEPPEDTMLIMTAVGQKSLKSTIYSRVQQIFIRPITKNQAIDYARKINKSQDADKAYILSQGDSGLFIALLNNEQQHPLKAAIEQGKEIITEGTYQRLIQIDSVLKDKENLSLLLFALKRIASAALQTAIKKEDRQMRIKWLGVLESVHNTESNIKTNSNTKLLLTDLFIRL